MRKQCPYGPPKAPIPSGNPVDACHGARVETPGRDGVRGFSLPQNACLQTSAREVLRAVHAKIGLAFLKISDYSADPIST